VAVDVGVRCLEQNLVQHQANADALGEVQAAYLLLFYAVECGMKAAVLRRVKGRGTNDLDGPLRTHDLSRLAKELRLSADINTKLVRCRRPGADYVEHHELHEAWRYGAKLDPQHEAHAVAGLRELAKWCGQERGK
jgi:HEPN domain-containing protein